MYSLGVKSFVKKDDEMETLFNAIKIVHGGGGYVTDYALDIIQKNLVLVFPNNENLNVDLTDFERRLLTYIVRGKSSTEIGFIFFKSPRTIEKHREKLHKKFNVTRKEELIRIVERLKLT